MTTRVSPYDSAPWRLSHDAISPDGRHRGTMASATETTMDNPRYGDLVIDEKLTIPDCSPAFVWSEDSRYLAVPRWLRRYGLFLRQQLLVWSAEEQILAVASPYYRLLIIERFDSDGLAIVDSPFRKPKPHRLSLTEFKRIPVESLRRRFAVYC